MNIFCRIFGHTWIHDVDEPKIAWNNDKGQLELLATSEGEPRFYERCVRCQERRPWVPKGGNQAAEA